MHPKALCTWACVALWAWVAVFHVTEGGAMTLWTRVLVEPSWLAGPIVQVPKNLSLILCGGECMRHDWCRLWCHGQHPGCLLTPFTVSGSYQPSHPEFAFSCYTSSKPELAFGASITSSPQYQSASQLPSNLVDGVDNGNVNLNAKVKAASPVVFAWFLLDVGVVASVSEVVLVAQPNTNAELYFKDIEVRVGNVQMSGDFTSYTLLGTFTGPGVPNLVVVLRRAVPLNGRFVSIQRTTVGPLQIAHLEIR